MFQPGGIVGKKIVLVDDSQTFLMYVGLLLKRLNYKIIPASDGVECLKLLKLTEPDAILLDLHMPPLDGLKILRHIKDDRQTSSIPIIMVSNDASPESIRKCMDLGAYDYLTKPLKIDRLHNVLEECFFAHRGTNRKHLRERFIRKLKVYCGGKECEYYTETLSEGGIYLRTREPHPIGTGLEITLQLNETHMLPVKGTVIYTKRLDEDFMNLPPGMAVQFNGLASGDVQMLKSYVADLLAKDILDSQEDRVIEK